MVLGFDGGDSFQIWVSPSCLYVIYSGDSGRTYGHGTIVLGQMCSGVLRSFQSM